MNDLGGANAMMTLDKLSMPESSSSPYEQHSSHRSALDGRTMGRLPFKSTTMMTVSFRPSPLVEI